MKHLLIIYALISLSSCSSFDSRVYNCGLSDFEGDWEQIWFLESENNKFLSIIEKKDKHFKDSNYKFWYQNKKDQILACGLQLDWNYHRHNQNGCFTIRHLLEKNNLSFDIVDSQEIVCTG